MSNPYFHHFSSKLFLIYSSVFFALCMVISFLLISLEFNTSLMLAIHAYPVMPEWFWSLMNLGGDAWVVLLILLLAERRPGQLTSWVLKTWLLGAMAVQLIKHLLPMPRPAFVLGLEQLSVIDQQPMIGGSMPSGHALAAVCCGLVLCTVFKSRGLNQWGIALIALLSVLVAWARVAVGAHWPADVIAGAGLACAVVAISHVWERRNSWNHWFKQMPGGVFLIVLHILISLHLVTPQSDFLIVQFVQFNLACISLLKAVFLTKTFLFSRQS